MKRLSAVARRFLTDDNDVRDALHDAYITVFTTIEHFDYRGPGSLQGWMHRIVVNECITILRRRKTSFVVPLEELPPSQLATAHPWQTSVSAAFGIQYNLARHVGLYFQPSADYYIRNNSGIETYYTEHPFTPSLQIGLRFKL